jgi:hypothetical protein
MSFLRMRPKEMPLVQESPYKLILKSNKKGDARFAGHDTLACFRNFATETNYQHEFRCSDR